MPLWQVRHYNWEQLYREPRCDLSIPFATMSFKAF